MSQRPKLIRPNFDIFDLPVKLGKVLTKCLSQNEVQSSTLQMDVSDFLYLASFLNHSSTYMRLVSKIEANFRTFDPTMKFGGEVGEISE